MAKTRTRWTPEQASALLMEFDGSRLSMAEFSRRRGFDPERLRRWRPRLGEVPAPTVPRLVELVPPQETAGVRVQVQVHCPSGHRVEVADVDLDVGLRAALAAVAELAPAMPVSTC